MKSIKTKIIELVLCPYLIVAVLAQALTSVTLITGLYTWTVPLCWLSLASFVIWLGKLGVRLIRDEIDSRRFNHSR